MNLFVQILTITLCVYGVKGGLYDVCNTSEDCGTLDSYCTSSKTCSCLEGFTDLDGKCAYVIQKLDCSNSVECASNTKGSICQLSKCTCIPYHHHVASDNLCTKNRGLDENCVTDNDCYWGMDMVDKMACINGQCSCKDGYERSDDRKCSGSESVIMSFLLLFCSLLITFY